MTELKDIKILMIEDDETHRKMYAFQFEKAGFVNFKTVASGQAGLYAAQQEEYDLILLDIGLEDIDGIAVLEQLKADSITTDIPVVVLSNMREEDRGEKAKELGAVDYILKAKYLPREVVERVKNILNRQSR